MSELEALAAERRKLTASSRKPSRVIRTARIDLLSGIFSFLFVGLGYSLALLLGLLAFIGYRLIKMELLD